MNSRAENYRRIVLSPNKADSMDVLMRREKSNGP
jgi:hypothetical protein